MIQKGIQVITQEDISALFRSVEDAAPRIRAWYALPKIWKPLINTQNIIEATNAISDFEKHKNHQKYIDPERYGREIHIKPTPSNRWEQLSKVSSYEICVFNPKNHLLEIKVRDKVGTLIQIDGMGWGNTDNASIRFEEKTAYLKEEDQDIAHKLGFEYSPANVLETDALSVSDFESHQKKKRKDAQGNTLLYCDNMGCQKQVRNPEVVIEPETGGLYHSQTCYDKDIRSKLFLAKKTGVEISPLFGRVSLDEAIELYERGELQQSTQPKNTHKFRDLHPWPEAAHLFG